MELELWQMALLVVVGIASGFLNVVAGGGGLLTVPTMVFMGMPGPVANGTNRIGVLAQSIASVIAFARSDFRDFKLSLSLSLCAVPGAVIGAFLGVNLEGVWFNRSLALIMLGVMLIMHFDRKAGASKIGHQPTQRQLLHGHLLMIGVGFWGGFIQLGVGFIIMPVLNRVMGLDLVRTNMHKVFIVAIYTIVALLVFASQLELFWIVGLILALGNAIGGYLGAHFSINKGERMIRLVLNLVLVVFVIKLLFDF
jgi:uncharacterized membrane protein YfcA